MYGYDDEGHEYRPDVTDTAVPPRCAVCGGTRADSRHDLREQDEAA